MKKINPSILTAFAAAVLGACGGPAGNTPANNTNTGTATPTAAAPTADALLALDRQATEAYFKGDAKFFASVLSDKFVMFGRGGSRMDKAATTRMIAGVKCDIKDGWKLEDPQVSTIDGDTYALSYKGTFDGTCTMDGKAEKAPSPIRAATVWVRDGAKWQAAFHGENPIIDPRNPPPPPARTSAKKEDLAAPAKATGDANTDALVKVERAVWEAWKAKDAKKLEELTAQDISFLNIYGAYFATKADTMKDWTEGKCDIKSVGVTDGVGTSLSPTVSILTLKGTAEGTCDGQKVGGAIYGTSVYLKDGDAWKWAFGLNRLPD